MPSRRPSVRPLPTPTQALPGSDAKIAVLQERARLHQPLFHPQDACHEVGAVAHANIRLPGLAAETGVGPIGRRWRARIWCAPLRQFLHLGYHPSREHARSVTRRARELLAPVLFSG
jgi:hypothetical protein